MLTTLFKNHLNVDEEFVRQKKMNFKQEFSKSAFTYLLYDYTSPKLKTDGPIIMYIYF